MSRATLAILLLATAISAPANAHAADSVTIRINPLPVVCIGMCSWFEARVTPEGRVTIRQFELSDKSDDYGVVVRHAESWRAQPRQAALFRAKLGQLRPPRDRDADANCAPILSADGTPEPFGQPKRDDILIIWQSGGRSVRLAACPDNRAVRGAVNDAMAALELYPDGNHWVKQQ